MKTKRCVVIAVLLLAIVLGGCAPQSSIRLVVRDRFPDAIEILAVDGHSTLWLVRMESEVLLFEYRRGEMSNYDSDIRARMEIGL